MGQSENLLDGLGIAKSIGNAIREARIKRGWTQQQLAERVGTRENMVSAYECGTRSMGLPRLKEFCRALGCKSSKLLPF